MIFIKMISKHEDDVVEILYYVACNLTVVEITALIMSLLTIRSKKQISDFNFGKTKVVKKKRN
jgi:hypothetical protein